MPTLAYSQPTFSLNFSPSIIGPGSIATLRYGITNSEPTPATALAFTNILPAGVTLATPAQAVSDCGDGTLTAPDGETTITLDGGILGANSSCTIVVDVTASTPGVHTNVTDDLTSSLGNSGAASGNLTVATDRPGFSKSFSPAVLSLGGRSTLTFTIDNSASPNLAYDIRFSDNLPTGIVIADPANASTDCAGPPVPPFNLASLGGTITAIPGTSMVSYAPVLYSNSSAVEEGSSCTVQVDVTAHSTGSLDNTTGELTSSVSNMTLSSGKAGAVLDVTADTLHLDKSFINDPATPGSTVDLQFSLSNFDRTLTATDISFGDDLDGTLAGLVALPASLPQNDVCGAGSLLALSLQQPEVPMLTLTGGTLGPGGTCTFSVPLIIPADAATGSYINTTGPVSADMGGQAEEFAGASDTLFINEAPTLTKTFLTDPVGAGGTTTVEFTVTNASPLSEATDIAFIDELTTFLPFPVTVTLPPTPDPPCGPESSLLLVSLGDSRQGLSLSGGSLSPAGTAGDSCTFSVDITIPSSMPSGTYLNITDTITATVNEAMQTGQPASDTLTIIGAPTLIKSFTDDPVLPGNTVTLEFTLFHEESAANETTEIAFSDDLTAVLTGLTAVGLPQNDICGSGSQLSGSSELSFTGGTLTPGESCTFSVTLQIPAENAFGSYTNTTSSVSAMVNGVAVTGNPAEDELLISPLMFSKTFTDDPVIPGDTVTLEFTLDNISPTANMTDIVFTDNLTAVLSGLVATDLPKADICGAGSQLVSTGSLLIVSGGNLTSGTSCTFSTTLQVPADAASDTYLSITSEIQATVAGSLFTGPSARDDLTVEANLLQLTKSFTNAPAPPGGTVTLEFTLSNQHSTESATSIAFSDDLEAMLSGLVATGLPVAACGGTLNGTGLLSFTDGTLAPGASCTFSVDLQIPVNLPSGTLATNTSSQITGTINGLAVTGAPASADLEIGFLTFNKSFSGKTRAGETTRLTFTLQNNNPISTASNLQFVDNLDNMLPGLVATGLPVSNACGAGSLLTGTGIISMSGAQLLAGESCTFSVNLLLPVNAPHGFFPNTTSPLTIQGESVASPATAILEIDNDKDDDGIMDQFDNCPDNANTDQANNDGDSLGDICDPDDDNDTIADTADNCPFTANTGQADFDNDTIGDRCDPDDDNDGIRDTWEKSNGLNPFDASDANWDNDDDGFTNLQEYRFGSDPNVFDADTNENGVPDRIDGIRGTMLQIWHLLHEARTVR